MSTPIDPLTALKKAVAAAQEVVLDPSTMSEPGPGSPLAYYLHEKSKFVFMGAGSDSWNVMDIGRYNAHLSNRNQGFGLGPKTVLGIPCYCEKNLKIDYVGQVAGKREGFFEENGTRFLVTRGVRLLKPEEGRWDLWEKILHLVFAASESPEVGQAQLTHIHSWLKRSYMSLVAGVVTNQQALIILGNADSGKSLIQHKLITPILGGQEVKAFDYFTGRTDFNGEFIEATHLFCDDNRMMSDRQSRESFAGRIKEFTVPVGITRYHAKGATAVSLRTMHRVSVMQNLDTADIRSLPELSHSLGDKISLLRASSFMIPVPNREICERIRVEEQLEAELPAYIWWLLNVFQIPAPAEGEEAEATRFGFASFKHPELIAAVKSESAEAGLLDIIDMHYFRAVNESLPGVTGVAFKEMNVSKRVLRDDLLGSDNKFVANRARQLIWHSSALHPLLKALESDSGRVKKARRGWTIQPPSEED